MYGTVDPAGRRVPRGGRACPCGRGGNHTWVEVFDGERWRFTGADEYDSAGLDRGWFTGDAAKAVAGSVQYAVWASAWRDTGAFFPLVWSRDDRSVPALDVTERYAAERPAGDPGRVVLNVLVFERVGGERLAVDVIARDRTGQSVGEGRTRAGRADLNDMLELVLAPGEYWLELWHAGRVCYAPCDARAAGVATIDLSLQDADEAAPDWELSRAAAEALVSEVFAARCAELRPAMEAALAAQSFEHNGYTLRTLTKRFGDAAEGERSLLISMHGGGGAPREVNDRQWQNQIRLYEPGEGFYVAPRAPTDTWNLWHQEHIDPLFQRLIDAHVCVNGVDPDRVFLMGYSAGGDGVYQLAPRMADRFAAAAMMAGHPNEAQPLGLRNLPFALFMGGNDAAYKRNEVAAQWGQRLGELAAADPGGYPHFVKIYPGKGHWMDGADKEALPWMAANRRDPWPKRVVWLQDDVLHTRAYWLAVAPEDAAAGRILTAAVDGQTITLESADVPRVTLRLRDGFVDLDQDVIVRSRDRELFRGRVARERAVIERSLAERLDPRSAATAELVVDLR